MTGSAFSGHLQDWGVALWLRLAISIISVVGWGLPTPLALEMTRNSASKSGSASDIMSLSDCQLAERFKFVKEIGSKSSVLRRANVYAQRTRAAGCWGSTWLVKPKTSESLTRWPSDPPLELAAVKLVHRSRVNGTTAARIRALWSEYKVIRSLRKENHPGLIAFSDFIITPSYALITMEYHCKTMEVGISETRAKAYCLQLLDAVGFLHRKGYTHNDLKVANVMVSAQDKAVLIDFGFAANFKNLLSSSHKRDRTSLSLPAGVGSDILGSSGGDPRPKEPFMSSSSWGTPEYLAPERAKGRYHDERLSDVWSLGVTMYEMVVGRTPFEKDEVDEFLTKEALEVYFQRTISGRWYGDYSVSLDFEHIIRSMVQADLQKRISTCEDVVALPFFTSIKQLGSPFKALKSAPHTSTPQRTKRDKSGFKVFVDPEGPITPPLSKERTSNSKENLNPATSPAIEPDKRSSNQLYSMANTALRSPSHSKSLKQGSGILEVDHERRRQVSEASSIPLWAGRKPPPPASTLIKSTAAMQTSRRQQTFSGPAVPSPSTWNLRPLDPPPFATPSRRATLSKRFSSSITAAVLKPSINSLRRSASLKTRPSKHSSAFSLIETPDRSCENGKRPPKSSLTASPVAEHTPNSSFVDKLDRIQAFTRQIDHIVEGARVACRSDRLRLPSPPPLGRQESANSGVLDSLININELEEYAKRLKEAGARTRGEDIPPRPLTHSLRTAGSKSVSIATQPSRNREIRASLTPSFCNNPAEIVSSDRVVWQGSNVMDESMLSTPDSESPESDAEAAVIKIRKSLDGADADASTVSICSSRANEENELEGEEDAESDAASDAAVGEPTEKLELVISSTGITQRLEEAGPSHFSTPSPTKDQPKKRISFDMLNFRPSMERFMAQRYSEDLLSRPAGERVGRVASPTPSFAERAVSFLSRPSSRLDHRADSPTMLRKASGLARVKSVWRRMSHRS